jgi:hypothetical protein
MTINVDFSGVQANDGNFDPLPDGIYNCSVFEVVVKENKAKDGHYLNWQLKVQDSGYANRRLFFTTSLKPQALWKLKQVLIRLAPDKEWDGKLSIEAIINTVEGLPCRAEVSYNDEYDNNNVDDLLAPAGEMGEDEDDDLPI